MVKNKMLVTGGAITIHDVNLSIQRKHYYYVTLHCVTNEHSNDLFGQSKLRIRSQTVALIEGAFIPQAAEFRKTNDETLKEYYDETSRYLQDSFKIVTVGAAVTAKRAGSSASRTRNALNHK